MQATLPRIAITPGEPAGIGPDLCIKLARHAPAARLIIIADPALMAERARQLDLPLRVEIYHSDSAVTAQAPDVLTVLPIALATPVIAGRLHPANAPYVLETLRRAVAGCMSGEFAALVTGPVHKGALNDAGIPFSGHTEFLAQLTHTAQPVMMLAAGELRVALVTTHLALREVSAAITAQRLEQVIRVMHRALVKHWRLSDPRILVCGLNPHAGEGGHLGREEIDVIEPVLNKLRGAGMRLVGPLPADTLFTPKNLQDADAVLAMYHDQGLPVLKHVGFGEAVNITLGLPIIRTSVDHGTALDLAGTGRAEEGSLRAALRTAIEMLRQ